MSPISPRGRGANTRGRSGPIQMWCRRLLIAASRRRGRIRLAAADLAHAGRHVVLSTGTASGKSVAYQLPILTALKADSRSRVLYLSPTKALGHDQLRAAVSLTEAVSALRDVAPSSYDGDSPTEVRRFARERSRWIFSNPDMIHLSLLRNHARWAVFLRNLRYVVIDECHYYRGVFGSNVAMVLRRLLRLSMRYSATGSGPTVIFASATTASPAITASELIGQTVAEVTEDGSPQGARTIALWEPALLDDLVGENGAPVRRSAGADAAQVMGNLIAEGARTLTFVRSRRGAELTALGARARLEELATGSRREGGVLSGGLSGRRPPRTGTRTGRRPIAGARDDQRPGTRGRHRRPRRRRAGRISRHGDVLLAAGGSRGPAGPERADRIDRP